MIYVDELISYQQRANTAQGRKHFGEGKKSCHMWADDEQELIAFAKRIGLRPDWIQRKSLVHFDLTPTKRAAAVRTGAQEVTTAEMVEHMRRLRDEIAATMPTFTRDPLYDPDTGQEAGHMIEMTPEYRAYLEGASE